MALMSVPEWAMPTQNTKSVMRFPHMPGRSSPVQWRPVRTMSE